MAQFPGAGQGKAQVRAIRVTKLTAACLPVGPGAVCVVRDCITNITTAPQITNGDRIAPKGGSGAECWVIEACDTTEYIGFSTLEAAVWSLKLVGLMADEVVFSLPAGAALGGGTDFGWGQTIGQKCKSPFALEIWSTVGSPDAGCSPTATELFWYELFPNVRKGTIAGATRDLTSPHLFGITGARAYGNSAWGAGPSGSPMPGGATLPANVGAFQSYWVDANGAALPLPAGTC